jgi:integrase
MELRYLKAFFNYIQQVVDFKFSNPVTSHHKEIGKIKQSKKKRKTLSESEIPKVLEVIPEPFNTLFRAQLLTGGRISEAAALKFDVVDQKSGSILINKVLVFCDRTKKVIEVKNCTKNGEDRVAHVGQKFASELLEISPNSEGFLFHINGRVLSYRKIQAVLDKALKEVGLYEEISGSHIFRYTSTGLVRNKFSLDHARAISGHKSVKMVNHYGALKPTEKNVESSKYLIELIKGATKDDQEK